MFSIATAENGAARVEWKGETALGADQLLRMPVDDEEKSALDEAVEFLVDELGMHPVTAKRVQKDGRDAGIAERTLNRAKRRLGVRSERESDGSWTWVMPRSNEEEKDGQPPDQDDLGNLGSLGEEADIDEGDGLGCQDGQHEHDDTEPVDEGDSTGGERGLTAAPSGGATPFPQQPDDKGADGRNFARVGTSKVEAALWAWAAEEPDILNDDPASIASMLSYSGRLDYEPDVNEVAEALRRVADGGVPQTQTVAAPIRRVAGSQRFATLPMSLCSPRALLHDRGAQRGRYGWMSAEYFGLYSPASPRLVNEPRAFSSVPVDQDSVLEKRGPDGPNTQRSRRKTERGVSGLPTRNKVWEAGEFRHAAWVGGENSGLLR